MGQMMGRNISGVNCSELDCIIYKNLIYGEDLNITIGRDEIWVPSLPKERLEDFFKDKMEVVGWVEIEHI
jgi:hypothetical protein